MKKYANFFMLIVLFTLLSNKIIGQVKSDYDKTIDFSKYKTYTLAGWEENSDQILTDFDKKRILDALQAEFSKRGLQAVQNDGDAYITLFIVVNRKTSTTAYTNYNGAMGYGGRWGWGYGGGMGTATTTYSENDYNEGTFVIDMYDKEGKNLIWQGIITSVVQEKPEKRDKTIPKKVAKLMKKYPIELQ